MVPNVTREHKTQMRTNLLTIAKCLIVQRNWPSPLFPYSESSADDAMSVRGAQLA